MFAVNRLESIVNIFKNGRAYSVAETDVKRRTAQLAERRAQKKRADRLATVDSVTLADGQVMSVPRTSLAAAKELLAAQKADGRRVMVRHAILAEPGDQDRLLELPLRK